MPRTNSNTNNDDEDKNAPFRSARRGARKRTASRASTERRLTIRSEQREQPDVRKIARAIIAMAVAEAERETQARAERVDGNMDSHPDADMVSEPAND